MWSWKIIREQFWNLSGVLALKKPAANTCLTSDGQKGFAALDAGMTRHGLPVEHFTVVDFATSKHRLLPGLSFKTQQSLCGFGFGLCGM
jgi:hypothetical protein